MVVVMASKKKHLKYRAAKDKLVISSKEQVSRPVPTPPGQKTSPAAVKTESFPKEKAAYTRLTAEQQSTVRKELWHVVAIAAGILAVYFILWLGFHYWGWSEVILRYVPHGQ
jgi:hypothetical protein